VYFNEFAPFGLESPGGYPIGNYTSTGSNQGYNCAPINSQNFLGWTNIFNVIGAVLAKAKAAGVNVYEMGIQDEMNTAAFTAEERYIYDNSMPLSAGLPAGSTVDVLSNLRSLMSTNNFDSGRVSYAAFWQDATVATENCENFYTDYARNIGLDTIAQGISGSLIGIGQNATATDLLWCGGTATAGYMLSTPMYSTPPDIVDAHIYPALSFAGSQSVQPVAALDYGDVVHFLTLAGQQSAAIVIGETYPGTIYPGEWGTPPNQQYCWLNVPSTAPTSNVAGFNQSSLAAYTVVFRPFMSLKDPTGECFAYGSMGPGQPGNYQGVNYNGNGPYTPTHP